MARNRAPKTAEKRVKLMTTIEIRLTPEEIETACREWAVREFGGKTVGSTVVDAQGVRESIVTFDLYAHDEDDAELRGATVTVRNQIVADDPPSDDPPGFTITRLA
jgi:hypothetical protein